MKKLLQEFETFITKGNAVDMMVGIVVGVGFTELVQSFVDHILLPPIGLLLGGVSFQNLYVVLSWGPQSPRTLLEAMEGGVPILYYGMFLSTLIDFLILAFVVFLVVRTVNRIRS